MGLRILSPSHCAFKIASIKCTCVGGPYRNSTATMSHSIQNVELHLTQMRMTRIQTSFPDMVSGSLWRCFCQTYCCSTCSGSWSQTILEVKVLYEEVLGRCGYTWSPKAKGFWLVFMAGLHSSLKCLWRQLMIDK